MTIIPVVLSGGSGTRLWPLSRAAFPKQLLSLTGDGTMLQETVKRLSGLSVAEPIVVCNEQHRFVIAEQLRQIGIKKPAIILEPVARNTAPAICAACIQAQKQDKDAVVVVLPSDHNIRDAAALRAAVTVAAQEALNGSLVTFGITPTFAATGYGYIEGDESGTVRAIRRFVEKPDAQKAQKYIDAGNFLWNSGMFVFKAAAYLQELQSLNAAIFDATAASIEKASADADFIRLDGDAFGKNPSISIDYAVMEKTARGKVVPLDAGWSDAGSWDSLWDVSQKDEHNNAVKGEAILRDVSAALIDSSTTGRTIAAIGVQNLVIVDTPDALLVADRAHSEDVKHIVDALKAAGKPCATESFEHYHHNTEQEK